MEVSDLVRSSCLTPLHRIACSHTHTQAFVLPPFTPTLRPLGAAATLPRRVHSLLQLRRTSAVGDNGGDKKDENLSNSGERRKRLMEDTLFSLETRAQQLAREVRGCMGWRKSARLYVVLHRFGRG